MGVADDLSELGKDLRRMGSEGKVIRRELGKAVRKSAAPVRKEVKAEARKSLPGDLGKWAVRGMRVTLRNKFGGRNPYVRMVIRRPNGNSQGGTADLAALNRGMARHLTWGHKPWHLQQIQGGFVDRVLDGPVKDRMFREFARVVHDTKVSVRRGR
jgi:hypothetical protein